MRQCIATIGCGVTLFCSLKQLLECRKSPLLWTSLIRRLGVRRYRGSLSLPQALVCPLGALE